MNPHFAIVFTLTCFRLLCVYVFIELIYNATLVENMKPSPPNLMTAVIMAYFISASPFLFNDMCKWFANKYVKVVLMSLKDVMEVALNATTVTIFVFSIIGGHEFKISHIYKTPLEFVDDNNHTIHRSIYVTQSNRVYRWTPVELASVFSTACLFFSITRFIYKRDVVRGWFTFICFGKKQEEEEEEEEKTLKEDEEPLMQTPNYTLIEV